MGDYGRSGEIRRNGEVWWDVGKYGRVYGVSGGKCVEM